MFKENYSVIGVMSGTSLDGVDLLHVSFNNKSNKWTFKLKESETVSYHASWLNKLKIAVDYSESELEILNEDYTQLLGEIINTFVKKHNIKDLDAVCSHGHTILHQPQNGFTLQIGNLPQLATLIQQKVVCDFRIQDVQLGGQGAPLVPIGDHILFADFDFCLNLGGFSNISFDENYRRIAFDIAPVNTILNHYANLLHLDYDDKGKIARSGNTNHDLLSQLNDLDFYNLKHPKSLGFEFVKEIVIPIIQNFEISIADKLNTFVEHIAFQTARSISGKSGRMLITGGGAYNDYLLERLQFYLPKVEIIVPDKKLLEFKEALIFALLGVLKLRNEINVLSSVTGASKDHSSGKIFEP